MNKLTIVICFLIAFTGCKPKEKKASQPDAVKRLSLKVGCYAYHADNNDISFEITHTGATVSGNLTYALSEKDANKGSFKGHLTGNKLIGTYTFASEGVESTREVAFLVKGDQLIEGYGPLNDAGKAFKDRDSIRYTSSMPLTKTDCSSYKK